VICPPRANRDLPVIAGHNARPDLVTNTAVFIAGIGDTHGCLGLLSAFLRLGGHPTGSLGLITTRLPGVLCCFGFGLQMRIGLCAETWLNAARDIWTNGASVATDDITSPGLCQSLKEDEAGRLIASA
jgi:hypothetical protein